MNKRFRAISDEMFPPETDEQRAAKTPATAPTYRYGDTLQTPALALKVYHEAGGRDRDVIRSHQRAMGMRGSRAARDVGVEIILRKDWKTR
jgi:hypothetical protein